MYEDIEGKLASAEHQIESLKEQLDDALQVEEMLVPLTERNLMLSEVRVQFYYLPFIYSCPLEN